MNNTLKTLLALALLPAAAIISRAQTSPKILVVDMQQLLQKHYETVAQDAKLKADSEKAQQELDRMNKEGNDLVAQYKELVEQTQNPTTKPEVKAQAEQDAQKKLADIQRKSNEVRTFEQNTQRALQQRVSNFRQVMFQKISKIAIAVAKAKGATLLLDKSGPTLLGIPSVIYADPAMDITDEVLAEINKGKPANFDQTAAAPAASSAPAAPSDDSSNSNGDTPNITVPIGGN